VRVLLGAIAVTLLYVFYREVRKIPAKLFTLMITAFVDMVGLLMIIPLLPFYVKSLGGNGIDVLGFNLGIGTISGIIVAAFTVAQLLSAPMWGRFSDRVGRRPTLLIAIGAAGISYLVFGFATSLWVLFLSRPRAGRRRRNSRRDSGLCSGLNGSKGPHTRARLVVRNDKSGRGAWPVLGSLRLLWASEI